MSTDWRDGSAVSLDHSAVTFPFFVKYFLPQETPLCVTSGMKKDGVIMRVCNLTHGLTEKQDILWQKTCRRNKTNYCV